MTAACADWGSGSSWMKEPLTQEETRTAQPPDPEGRAPAGRAASRTIGERGAPKDDERADASSDERDRPGGGRVLGTFRNTYYHFPREADYAGDEVALMNASCTPIAKVSRGFYDAVCVQGSGSLRQGKTVSFAQRDCACAEVCPRTGQRICFDALDAATFPWGRGAAGKSIVPMRSVAADTSVLPMGTVLYIPEFDGATRAESDGTSDGCFVVEDRGLKVRGEHVDIFTGTSTQTAILNARVPSNQGVTIIVDAPRCAHLAGH